MTTVPLKKESASEKPQAIHAVRKRKNGNIAILTNQIPMHAENPTDSVPSIEHFEHFTHDKTTLGVMKHIAFAVSNHLPCLLEGHTAASKTSSIEYLASLSNTPCYRLNLNGQTDTSELIGKFVPNDGQLQIDFEHTLTNPHLLSLESKQILIFAQNQNRTLTQLECQKIASLEGIKTAEWQWKDGVIPHAMKNGGWVILDEMNLAEAQVLERLNPVLEKNPVLTLSENGGLVIGGNAHPVHPSFRMFGTMNPAEYTGRMPLSPAYKDRWQGYMYVPTPGREEYAQMLQLMTFGEQPKVTMDDVTYSAEHVSPLFPKLASVPNIHLFLPLLAQFHADMATKAEKKEFGKDTREKLIFTRRTLLSFMDFLDKSKVINPITDEDVTITEDPKRIILEGIHHFYLKKIKSPDDVKKVQDLLEALKLTEKKWGIDFTTPTSVKASMKKKIDTTLHPVEGATEPTEMSAEVKEELDTLFNVKEEYNAQRIQYIELGWLKSKDGKDCIKDNEGNFYPVPTLEQIYEALQEKLDLLKYKANQGFTRFILAPIGLSYMDMYYKLGDEYTRYQADPGLGLYRTDSTKTKYDQAIQATYFSDSMKKEADCYYYPETLSEGIESAKHKGKTKSELIASSKFPGWEIHILPQDTKLPRAGTQGTKEKGGRIPLPANLKYKEYVDILKKRMVRPDGHPSDDVSGEFVFQGENGLIPEVWVSLAMQKLREHKTILSDYYGNDEDCAAILTGMLTRSNSVPLSCFNANPDSRQVRLGDGGPGNQHRDLAGGSSVKVC